MNELLVVSFIFLNIFSSYPTSFNLSRSFKTIIRRFQNILTIFFVKQVKFIVYQYKIPFSLVKHWNYMILVMSNGNTYNSQCLLFYFSRLMKRPQEVVESINKDVYLSSLHRQVVQNESLHEREVPVPFTTECLW